MNPNLQRLRDLARQAIKDRPDLSVQIIESMQLSVDEIQDGGSPEHELELFETNLNQMKGNA